jgi:hypothetical protein
MFSFWLVAKNTSAWVLALWDRALAGLAIGVDSQLAEDGLQFIE